MIFANYALLRLGLLPCRMRLCDEVYRYCCSGRGSWMDILGEEIDHVVLGYQFYIFNVVIDFRS